MTGSDTEQEVAEAFAHLARQLQAQEGRESTWQCIVEMSSEFVPAAEHAAVSLVYANGRVDTVAATGDIASRVDDLQYETGEGPCLSAIRDEGFFVTGRLSAESRWPRFSARAAEEIGVESMLAFRLFVHEGSLGALNLYSSDTDAFDRRAEAFGDVLAAHAAIAMSAADTSRQVEQLEEAMAGNRVIGMAIGILLLQTKTDRAGAFAMLSQASQRRNVKLRTLAERIVTGAETGRATPPVRQESGGVPPEMPALKGADRG